MHITGTSTTGVPTAASIYIPPWAGGVPFRKGPLDSGCAHHPPVDPLRTDDPAPLTTSSVPEVRLRDKTRLLLLLFFLNKLEVVEGGRGLVHQLFPHLRHAEHSALRDDVLEVILGTSITCSGTTVSMSLRTCTSWPTGCGTGASKDGTGTNVSSTGLHGALRNSSSYRLKRTGWGGVFLTSAV